MRFHVSARLSLERLRLSVNGVASTKMSHSFPSATTRTTVLSSLREGYDQLISRLESASCVFVSTPDTSLETLTCSPVGLPLFPSKPILRSRPFDLHHSKLRILFTQKPHLGEKLWRSFQRRRELLLKSNFRGLTVYGEKRDKGTVDTLELLFRNSIPHEW